MRRVFMYGAHIVCGLMMTMSLWAQTAQDTLVLTLDKALEIALSENNTIQIANKEIERKQYVKDEVVSSLIPQINIQATYSYALLKQKMYMELPGQGSQEITMGRDHTVQGAAALQVPLVAPSMWKNIEVSNEDIALSMEKARSSRLSMAKEVKDSYYRILVAQHTFRVIQETYLTSVTTYEKTRSKFKVGACSEYDLIRAEVRMLNQEPSVFEAYSSLDLANFNLKVLLGIGTDIVIKTVGDLRDYEQQLAADIMNIDSTRLSNNSDLKQLDIQASMMQKQKQMIATGYAPTLSANANYAYYTQVNTGNTPAWVPNSTVGLTLNIPIFDGLTKHYKTKQMKVSIDALQLQKELLSDQLKMQVRSSLNDIKKSMMQIDSNRKGIEAAKKGYDIANIMFDNGTATILELNDSQLAYLNSELTYVQSIYGFLTAKTQLEKVLGSDQQ